MEVVGETHLDIRVLQSQDLKIQSFIWYLRSLGLKRLRPLEILAYGLIKMVRLSALGTCRFSLEEILLAILSLRG
jgi:hypothetical protein